jgi:hypothetical protein
VGFAVQSVCPGLTVAHADLPRSPPVVAMTLAALGTADPVRPGDEVCGSGS